MSSCFCESKSERPLRILIVEDDPAHADLVCEVIHSSLPFSVDISIATSLSEAVEKLRERYDVIVADLGLPDSNGDRTIEELSRCNDDAPIVCLTATSGAEWPYRLIRAGADDYLEKSDSVMSVGRAILNAIARAGLRKESKAVSTFLIEKVNELTARLEDIEKNRLK
jgi:DNA-binding response OmpR family regulator